MGAALVSTHPGALSASSLTLSKPSSLGLESGDFQTEDGGAKPSFGGVKKKKSPKSFMGVRLFPSTTAKRELMLRG